MGQSAEPVAEHGRFENMFMISAWWNFEHGIHFEIILQDQPFNSEVYCEQQTGCMLLRKGKYPAFVNSKRKFLQRDNARPHTSCFTREKVEELEGIELLPHPHIVQTLLLLLHVSIYGIFFPGKTLF
ncbi:hypothetical protein AVEN_61185-1 [Araneus ventricosus]|uniref:Mariner Mos1 transposase n=1 Tax=Araneus ventricosus TaxID=182803 RepID=A0A4Y2PBR7_ARAVE|nr:hypothetical protein AVEN_61185-1 [Araneus ventricosus]